MTIQPLQHELFRRSFDDGWLDLIVGLGLAGIGAAWMMDYVVAGAAIPAILVPLWLAGRKSIIEPRLAQPRFREGQRQAMRRNLSVWLILGVAVLLTEAVIVFAVSQSGILGLSNAADVAVGIPAALVALGLLAGLLTGARRFLAYALAGVAIAAAGIFTGSDTPGLLIALCGTLPLLAGIILLSRFMQHHPVTETGDNE